MALPVGVPMQSVAAAPTASSRSFVWNERFDFTLLVAPLALGLLAAAVVTSNPALYAAVVVADLWFLGYHHVVSTYTRLGFSSRTLRRNRFLAVDLLVVIVLATMALAFTAGAWIVASAFLYLQWFHYMRQGYGISRMYFRSTPEGQVAGARDLVADAVIYVVPIFAIAHRSMTMGDMFLAMPIKTVAPPQACCHHACGHCRSNGRCLVRQVWAARGGGRCRPALRRLHLLPRRDLPRLRTSGLRMRTSGGWRSTSGTTCSTCWSCGW
jgi:hypothetical protein